MTDSVLKFIKEVALPGCTSEGWTTLQRTRRIGLIARIENAFVAWQAARLQQMSPERLWAAAMQDKRSLAEIRRARNAAQR